MSWRNEQNKEQMFKDFQKAAKKYRDILSGETLGMCCRPFGLKLRMSLRWLSSFPGSVTRMISARLYQYLRWAKVRYSLACYLPYYLTCSCSFPPRRRIVPGEEPIKLFTFMKAPLVKQTRTGSAWAPSIQSTFRILCFHGHNHKIALFKKMRSPAKLFFEEQVFDTKHWKEQVFDTKSGIRRFTFTSLLFLSCGALLLLFLFLERSSSDGQIWN